MSAGRVPLSPISAMAPENVPSSAASPAEKIAAVFERAGAKEKFTGGFYDEPHHYTRQMQNDAFGRFDRQLGVKS